MFDLTCDDFLQPPCHSVLPHNNNLLGVRMKIEGLLSRSDLNGKIVRCGVWMEDFDRYQVFLPACEGSRSLSVKPDNLRIADPVSRNELASLMSTISLVPKRFPEVIMTINVIDEPSGCLKRPLLDVIADPPDWKHESKCRPVTDTYRGPVSGSAQAILQVCSLAPTSSSMISCIFTAAVCSDSGSTKQAKMAKKFATYSKFVKELMERDKILVRSFETGMAEIDDSAVRSECGKSLKIVVQLDGISPPIQRELLVSPEITMRCLHDQVLCPAMGWKSNYHAYAFRKNPLQSDCVPVGDLQDAIKDTCWIGPKVCQENLQCFFEYIELNHVHVLF